MQFFATSCVTWANGDTTGLFVSSRWDDRCCRNRRLRAFNSVPEFRVSVLGCTPTQSLISLSAPDLRRGHSDSTRLRRTLPANGVSSLSTFLPYCDPRRAKHHDLAAPANNSSEFRTPEESPYPCCRLSNGTATTTMQYWSWQSSLSKNPLSLVKIVVRRLACR
jgi:hypothetical protein